MGDGESSVENGLPLHFAVAGWLALTALAVTTPGLRSSVLRPATVYPTTLLVPGYVIQAALFGPIGDDPRAMPDRLERIVLAVALSVAFTMAVGVFLTLVPIALTPATTLVGMSIPIAIGLEAIRRRWDGGAFALKLPTTWRPRLPTARPSTSAVRTPAVVLGLVVACGLAGAVGAGYLTTVHDPPGYAEFSVYPGNGSADFPGDSSWSRSVETFNGGDDVRLALRSRRSTATEYTIVSLVQRTESDAGTDVVDSRRVDQFTVTLDSGERWSDSHRPSIPWNDGPVRLVYRLYGTGSDEPRAQLHFWVDTDDAGGAPSVDGRPTVDREIGDPSDGGDRS